MTATLSQPLTTTTPIGGSARLRRTVGATCLPLTFLVMLIGAPLLDPLDDSASESTILHQAFGHAGQIAALGWAEILTGVLTLAGLMTVVGAIRSRGAGWANATGVIAVTTVAGLIGIAMNHFVISGLASSNLTMDQQVEAFKHFHSAGGPIVVLIIASALGFLTAAVAAWRSGLSSPLVLVPAAAFLVASSAPGDAAEYTSMAAGLVMTAWISRDLLRS